MQKTGSISKCGRVSICSAKVTLQGGSRRARVQLTQCASRTRRSTTLCHASAPSSTDQREKLEEAYEASASASAAADVEFSDPSRPPKVVIAGGGIAGLVLAVALLKKGINVSIYEQDVTAIRGEGKYRGPIQVQSNALAALEAIDVDMARDIMASGCVTGDRINGLCDGVSGDWYCKFDTYHPAVNNGMPVTRVISRVVLQEILAEYAAKLGGPGTITNASKVVGFREDVCNSRPRVWAQLEDGTETWGDILIGADGIWSKVRRQLVGPKKATYSGYTCYTGISDFVCPDIDTIAYRVFLGNRQYFVSSDVGDGKMQWYAFHEEEAGGSDTPGEQKQRLMGIFGHWNDMVTDLIAATPEDDVLRRDIFDRPPMFKWTGGRVALLGDSAHAMQPNLGQGGCMAIEDAYELAKLVSEAVDRVAADARGVAAALPYERVLQRYQRERVLRASAIHGMARMAAIAASTYKAYLGEQFGLDKYVKIPHPGRVIGRLALAVSMPAVLGWVLGGNTGKIKAADRAQYCNISDVPHGFGESDWKRLMSDDEALLAASKADWLLVPVRSCGAGDEGICATALDDADLTLGATSDCDVCLEHASVCARHARVTFKAGKYYLAAESADARVWLNGQHVQHGAPQQLHPGDELAFGSQGEGGPAFKVKQLHRSQREAGLLTATPQGAAQRYVVNFPHLPEGAH